MHGTPDTEVAFFWLPVLPVKRRGPAVYEDELKQTAYTLETPASSEIGLFKAAGNSNDTHRR